MDTKYSIPIFKALILLIHTYNIKRMEKRKNMREVTPDFLNYKKTNTIFIYNTIRGLQKCI